MSGNPTSPLDAEGGPTQESEREADTGDDRPVSILHGLPPRRLKDAEVKAQTVAVLQAIADTVEEFARSAVRDLDPGADGDETRHRGPLT